MIAFYMADFLVDEATVTGAIAFVYSLNDEIKFSRNNIDQFQIIMPVKLTEFNLIHL